MEAEMYAVLFKIKAFFFIVWYVWLIVIGCSTMKIFRKNRSLNEIALASWRTAFFLALEI